MQLKPITAIIVLALVVASLLVAGCTTSNTNQTPTPSTATHDAFLEKYLAAIKDRTYSNKNMTIESFEVTWINSTSARLGYVTNYSKNATINETIQNLRINWNDTFIVFPTTQDATNYLNAMNKTYYSESSNVYISGSVYDNVIGHATQVYKQYEILKSGHSEYIQQRDNLISLSSSRTV